MTTTETQATTPAVQACPPSAVADQIVRWFEVDTGELVLYNGKLRSLEAMWPVHGATVGVRLLHGGVTADFWVDSTDLTAVRRYTEGEHPEVERLRAELDRFKPQPMSQRCRDGHHNGTGDMRCINCFCLCHRGELSKAKRALYAAALDEAADDRDVRARYSADACDRQHTKQAGEYRQARDELLEASR